VIFTLSTTQLQSVPPLIACSPSHRHHVSPVYSLITCRTHLEQCGQAVDASEKC